MENIQNFHDVEFNHAVQKTTKKERKILSLIRGAILAGTISCKTAAKRLTKHFFLFPQNRLFQKKALLIFETH